MESADRALALDPGRPDVYQTKAMVLLAQGDLAGARGVLAAAQREVEPTALAAWFATYYDLFWVLDDASSRAAAAAAAGAVRRRPAVVGPGARGRAGAAGRNGARAGLCRSARMAG